MTSMVSFSRPPLPHTNCVQGNFGPSWIILRQQSTCRNIGVLQSRREQPSLLKLHIAADAANIGNLVRSRVLLSLACQTLHQIDPDGYVLAGEEKLPLPFHSEGDKSPQLPVFVFGIVSEH